MIDRSQMVKEYINRYFPKLNKTQIARKFIQDHPDAFENVEAARSFVRKRMEVKTSAPNPEMETQIEEDIANGKKEIEFKSDQEIKTLEELIAKCNIDTTTWHIERYIQNYWGNSTYPHWQVKAWLSKKNEEQLFQDAFVGFLGKYKPSIKFTQTPKKTNLPNACLIINKQDAHLNKLDVNGDNDIEARFTIIQDKIKIITEQARLSNTLESITYILGSDEFNSEFTGTTTKGTPQQNIGSYQGTFELICNHNVNVILTLLKHAKTVNIVFVSGNHDEVAGWHMVNWLKTYFRDIDRITFDTSPKYRKYLSYGKTALMFNHGDAIKPVKLAAMFPMEFRQNWSAHDYFYIFTGDKHHELSHDFNGIKFYQLPALSSARSLWDEKNGYTCAKAEVNAFLIDELYGMTNIYKQYLN